MPGLFGLSEKLSKAGTADFSTLAAKDGTFRSLQCPWDDNLTKKGGPNLIQHLYCDRISVKLTLLVALDAMKAFEQNWRNLIGIRSLPEKGWGREKTFQAI